MRFHVLGVPHTVTNHKFVACAYTQKAFKFCKMMKARGHHVIHYGHEDSDPDCNEHVTVVTNEDFNKAYGSYDWKKEYFKYKLDDAAYTAFYKNAIREIGKRKQKYDFILPFWGSGVRKVCDAHRDLICVEPGIGYATGHWAKFKVFESYAILHAYMNLNGAKRCNAGNYDVVIPNYFDPEEFEFSAEKDDYVLFLGRVYSGKGLHVAVQATGHVGAKLLVAGQKSMDKSGYKTIPSHVTELGHADLEQRKKLLSRARCVITASQFLEPFCGVHMEALMSGTPVISTDWGVFTETNLQGITGYRCRTFNDFVWAIKNSHKISPYHCREWAMNYSLDQVADRYEKYFKDVLNVAQHKGWYDTLEPVSHLYIPKYPNTSVDPRYVGIGVDTTRGETSVCNNLDWAIIKDTDDLQAWKQRARHVTVAHTSGKNRHLMKYKDIHKGKKGLIVCNGPSAKDFDFSKLDSDTIVVGFNGIFMTELSKYLDYYFVNDFGNECYKNCARSNPKEFKEFQPKIKKFFSHKLQLWLDYTDGYEMFYYRDNVNLIERDGCVIPNPDFLGEIDDDLTQPITTFGSVTFVGMQFLVWCGIKDIDIIGVDINNPLQVTGENRRVPYAVVDHLLYWCKAYKHYEKSDVVFRKSLKDLMKFPQTSRTIMGKGTNLEFACDVLNVQYRPGVTEYEMNKYDLVNYLYKNKNKLKWYYFYTQEYDIWNKHLSENLGGHFDVQPLLVESLDIHTKHDVHIFTGSITKIQLIIDAIKKNMGQKIVFTDATWSINKNKVQELYNYLDSISETTYVRNSQYLKNPKTMQNIGFILLNCDIKELELWEKCLEIVKNDKNKHDQAVINTLIDRNSPTFDVTKIIADQNPKFDSEFYAIKFFVSPLIDAVHRNSERLAIVQKHGLQPVVHNSIKVAYYGRKGWCMGRIHSSLRDKLRGEIDIDMYDWGNLEQSKKLWYGEWKKYDAIIGNTAITYLPVEKNFMKEMPEELKKKLIPVMHSEYINHVRFKEVLLTTYNYNYCGITPSIVDIIKKNTGLCDVHLVPIGVNTDDFKKFKDIKCIETIGQVSIPNHDQWYKEIKRPEWLKQIADGAEIKYEYIHGKPYELHSKLYENIDMLVVTSVAEGVATSICEAAACGIPVISTKVGYAKQLRNIKTFDTVDEAIDIINYFNTHPKELKEYSEKLMNEVRTEWNWDLIAHKYWKPAIQKVINKKKFTPARKHGLQPMDIQNFWETSDPQFSHLHTRLMDDPENNFMKFIDFANKTVLDYGCGSAVLGKTLFDQKGINKYIGVDISKRSLEYSKNTLKDYEQAEFLHESEYYDSSPRCDIFISRACIQHFPDMEYLNKFLGKIKEIGPGTVMLQIRNNGSNMCNNRSYDSIKNIVDRCYTTPEYILEKLGNDYNIWFKSQVMKGTMYQFIIFSK